MSDKVIVTNNPAERLHRLIVEARSQHAKAGNRPLLCWAVVFGIEVKGADEPSMMAVVPEIVARLVMVSKLVEDVQEGLEQDATLFDPIYLEALPPIRQILAVSLSRLIMPVDGLMNTIDARQLAFLEMAARYWYRLSPEPRIDEKELETVLKEARELFNSVHKSRSIPLDLRKLILSMLAAIEQAIQQYRIRGPRALEEGMMYIMGQLQWNSELVQDIKKDQNSEAWKWFDRVTKVGAKLFSVITFAEKNRPAISAVGRVLHLLVSGEPKIPPVDTGSQGLIK
jgi:predicted DNA-binding protein (MmcQ/YjbR family)